MRESEVQNRAMLALGRGVTRLFRNNTGMGWVGDMVMRAGGRVTLRNARPLHAGLCRGSSDAIGWHTITITPQMVGQRVAVFTAIEFKRTGVTTPTIDQAIFGEQVKKAGGIFGVANSVEDAINIISRGAEFETYLPG